jgi:hypothetical protein
MRDIPACGHSVLVLSTRSRQASVLAGATHVLKEGGCTLWFCTRVGGASLRGVLCAVRRERWSLSEPGPTLAELADAGIATTESMHAYSTVQFACARVARLTRTAFDVAAGGRAGRYHETVAKGATTDEWHNLVDLKLAAITELDTLCRLVFETVSGRLRFHQQLRLNTRRFACSSFPGRLHAVTVAAMQARESGSQGFAFKPTPADAVTVEYRTGRCCTVL